ncbi:MAG: YkgJ family cysteine cluster protein, partial [Chlamydiae bacterium]|nr:YkgJ family cysteine cluster protein [Chlamydiota bacterium]
LSVEEVKKRFIRKLGDRQALIEQPPKQGQYDCIFLKDKRCTIYPVRPKQCKTFPWWTENLSSPKAWEEAAKSCEGINHPDAPLVSFDEILQQNQ